MKRDRRPSFTHKCVISETQCLAKRSVCCVISKNLRLYSWSESRSGWRPAIARSRSCKCSSESEKAKNKRELARAEE